MKRVLIVAYYFPPIGGIGSIRMARFAEYLPRYGWEPTVIAPGDTPHPQDPNLRVTEEAVIRTRSLEISRLGRVVPSGSSEPASGSMPRARRVHAALRRQGARLLAYPDGQIGWYPDAVRKGARALADGTFDAVYSSSNPMTAHLVARTLHRRSHVPWVAEFRDPWGHRLGSDHPFHRHAERLERRLATEADRVIVPTPTMASHLTVRWDREVDLVMNGHDLGELAPAAAPEHPTLTHVGTYYPHDQNLRAVWEAVRRERQAGNHAAPRLRFVGVLPPELRRELESFGLDDLVEVTGFLPLEDAVQAMRSSSLLLASGFGGADPLAHGVIPAKVFEYLASGLPILYVGSPQDDTWRLLSSEPGSHLIEPDDVDRAAAAIHAALEGTNYPRDTASHSRNARTAVLARILDEASGRVGGRS